jgi:ribosomal protein S18 acetylase RimI-like enzyme
MAGAGIAVAVRDAHAEEVDALARLWHDAWQDAHAAILPAALARVRTLASFRTRLLDDLPQVRATGAVGAPSGFCIAKQDELYQLFVSAEARGSGVAAALLADGEARLARGGTEIAWLACAIGNARAARFYERHGWRRVGSMVSRLDTTEGVMALEVWRYEKRLIATR